MAIIGHRDIACCFGQHILNRTAADGDPQAFQRLLRTVHAHDGANGNTYSLKKVYMRQLLRFPHSPGGWDAHRP